jgi:hypothetical protein
LHPFGSVVSIGIVFFAHGWAAAQSPLPSWNEGAATQGILDFVAKVTKERSPDFVPIDKRIAVFDNDGTLWSEQPMYFEVFFIFDRIKALAPEHPEWREKKVDRI